MCVGNRPRTDLVLVGCVRHPVHLHGLTSSWIHRGEAEQRGAEDNGDIRDGHGVLSFVLHHPAGLGTDYVS